MEFVRKATVYAVCLAFVLSGCAVNSGSRSSQGIGPQLSSLFSAEKLPIIDPNKPKLDIVIPVFDPGLPEDEDDENIWPELRRAEALRFAYKLKLALDKTGAFGAVRITPDKTATGDLYLLGTIIESDGEDVEIDIEAFDISGARWFGDSFDHSVDEKYHNNLRNKGIDPYDPVFEEVAQFIVNELQYYGSEELTQIRRVTDMRFGAIFSPEAFAEYLNHEDNRYTLTGYPSNNDPMLVRTNAIRVRDQLFVDGLQDNYRAFSEQMDLSYFIWQEQSQLELQAKREAQAEATAEAIGGVLLIGLAVLAIAAGSNSNSVGASTAASTAGIIAGVAGTSLMMESWQTSKEAEVHVDALEELGESIDRELAPRVIAYENETVELTGTAREQFIQWRDFLKLIHEKESVPEAQL